MIKLFINLFFLFSFTFGQVEDNRFVSDEVLIQLNKNSSIENFLSSLEMNEKITSHRPISEKLGLYAVKFDLSKTNLEDFINDSRQDSEIKLVQKNHVIKSRNLVPNDTFYDEQWQYSQANDFDIDADEAWDITTGGLTANGIEIVAAVIDNGIDQDHEDFEDNIWVNPNEIPGNNLDDDDNGYIDDVNGWNIVNNTGNINTNGDHGTPVSGIIGAKGDNNTGVAGVNWNIKQMIINSGFSVLESDVLEAYSYILEMRELFNSTNGEQGAYVVATNASWGLDFGNPADAPLWCGMYDSLGEAGILSMGATANLNINVDEQGDLPTACPSDYLITVTNMNQNDEKVLFAGYGARTIDLGAPGQNAFTMANSNSYAGFGGTSGATPHVTGAVSLLYSVPSTSFIEKALSEPAETALNVKNYILQGVDENTSLRQITVTGGRLNVFKSIQLLLNDHPLSTKDVDYLRKDVAIFPNPVIDYVNFNYLLNDDILTTLNIYASDGKLLGNYDIIEKIKIDLSDLKAGVYMLSFGTQKGDIIHKTILKK